MDTMRTIDWYEITETGLVIDGDYSEQDWQDLGVELARNAKSMMWLIGDWLLAGEGSGYLPRGKLDQACEMFGIAKPTAKQAINVCRKIERDIRISLLPFAHHQLVA